MNNWENEIKKNIVNNFHLLTENQRLPNMLGQRLYNMLGQRFYYMLGQRLYNMLGQRFLDEQSADGFASRNQRWPNENCSLRPNVGPTSTCYLGYLPLFTFNIFKGRNSGLFCPIFLKFTFDNFTSPVGLVILKFYLPGPNFTSLGHRACTILWRLHRFCTTTHCLGKCKKMHYMLWNIDHYWLLVMDSSQFT